MRIALVHYRLARKGGLETRLFNYAEWFAKEGHEVTIIFGKQKGDNTLPANVKTIQTPVRLYPKPIRRIIFSNKVEKILGKEKFDFSLSLGRTVGQDAVLAAANHRGFLKALGKKKKGVSDWSQDRMDLLSFQKTSVIFAASEMMKDELVELYGIDPGKIHVLFPPIHTQNFASHTSQSQALLKDEVGMDKAKISCCFVSTSHYRKGLDVLLKVFEALPKDRFELFVAGDSFKTNLPHVRHLGFLKDPSRLFAAADFCLHPARFEPFGQIVTESLQSGTPVITSHMVGAKEIITPQVGKVIHSLDWQDWYEAISKLDKEAFNVPQDFVQKQKLDLDNHLSKMLSIMNLQ